MGATPLALQDLVDQFVGVAHSDLMRVKDLLAWQSQLINRRATWNETALGAAAHTAQVAIAEFLLSVGAPLDICTATMLGRAAVVRRMLGADPALAQARGAHDLPVLYYAAIQGRVDLAELLARHGADVDADGAPLHGAIAFDQPATVEWLLEHSARPDRMRAGRTPLEAAQARGNAEVIDVLRRHGAVEATLAS